MSATAEPVAVAIVLDMPRSPNAAASAALLNPEASPSQRHESTEASCTNAYPETIALFHKTKARDAESGAILICLINRRSNGHGADGCACEIGRLKESFSLYFFIRRQYLAMVLQGGRL